VLSELIVILIILKLLDNHIYIIYIIIYYHIYYFIYYIYIGQFYVSELLDILQQWFPMWIS
jgi:hypothetical protein